MFGFDVGGFIIGTIVLSLVVPLVITGVIIGLVVWAIRRSVPSGWDAAVQHLRARFAKGEIDLSEFSGPHGRARETPRNVPRYVRV